jgi:hypothetical protein
MSFPQKNSSGTPGFPAWVRAVAVLLVVALVAFFVISAF